MILAGDIGGTNTRLAIFEGTPARPRAVVIEIFPSAAHSGLREIVQKFRAAHPEPIRAACFGVAGAVVDGKSKPANLPWIVDAAELASDLGLPSVRLANDLEVNAYGIAVLGTEDFVELNRGAPDASGNRVLISAGTGLGQAGLFADGKDYKPWACEGGHTDFAPRDETEIALLEYLLKRFDHVSVERALSGPGLYNIYQFLRDTGRAEEPAWLAEKVGKLHSSAAISELAMKNESPLCVQALDLFVSIYGAEAGNLALKGMATGGVYLGGGIAPKILPKLQAPAFMRAFTAKGRSTKLLEAMPVRVILNDKTALLGAGRLAMLVRDGLGE
jgi:glucokinase